ncbi:hypothetical protein [Streptomyces sp. H27-C3]|uniref:hypothetical protein n=1 Tax=Streptomyces sp. H27-C3 TaxID=3046305 RepID=UPI0024BBCAC4|nr:hypothetical protein [Streptomyces sp. H27-C3]MDJ0466873.1 hypothetical protein [Streptomyces sp. H27-C3]
MTKTDGPRVLPGPASAIQLTYTQQECWFESGEDEPVIWNVSADLFDHERDEIVEHIGAFEFFRADPFETRDLFGVLDGHDGDVGLIAETILDVSSGQFHDDLDDFTEPIYPGMLILNSAKLVRKWRGFGVGAALVGRAINRLSAGCRGAACYPAPLDGPDEDRETAVASLQKTWQQLGFKHYRDGVFLLNLGTVTLGEALPGLIKRVDALPQPDVDDCRYGAED